MTADGANPSTGANAAALPVSPGLEPQGREKLLASTAHTPVAGLRTPWGLISGYWRASGKNKRYAMAAGLAALTLTDVYINVWMAYWWKDIFDAAIARNLGAMGTQTLVFMGLAGAHALTISVRHYMAQAMHMSWRGWLTRQFNESWLMNKSFFHIQNVAGTIDNPDQRIAEDTGKLPGHLLGMGMGLLGATTTLISFSVVMIQLAGTTQASFLGKMITVPDIGFWVGFGAALGTAALGTLMTHKVGAPLVDLNAKQLKREGDFRSTLFEIRNNASEIASYEGQKVERSKLRKAFDDVRSGWYDLMSVNAKLMFSTTMYGETSRLVSLGVSGVAYALSKNMTAGGIMQFSQVFDQLRGAMSWFIHVYPAIAEVKAVTKRLNAFAENIEQSQTPARFYEKATQKADIAVKTESRDSILVKDLVLRDPVNEKPLLTLPELEIKQGSRILVTGESGCGKSTFLRAISGLWKYGSGEISLPQDRKILSASQVPYILDRATLRENICYPFAPESIPEEKITEALRLAELSDLAPHLDKYDREGSSWRSLSVGEKQRIIFARFFLHKPDVLFLDEATSALDPELQEKIYCTLLNHIPQATIISIAHRHEVVRHHDTHFVIKDGKLSRQAIAPPSPPPAVPPAP